MKDTGRPVAVFLERAEERGAIAGRHALQDGQVKLQNALRGVEHPAEVQAETARDVLHLDLGHQVEVEFGAQLSQR